MSDPLSLLREQFRNNKNLVAHDDTHITIGDLKFPRNTTTPYKQDRGRGESILCRRKGPLNQTPAQTSQSPAQPSQTPGQTSEAGTAECETGWMTEAFGRLLPAKFREKVEVVQRIQEALTAAKIGSEQELLAMTRQQMLDANVPISARPHFSAAGAERGELDRLR